MRKNRYVPAGRGRSRRRKNGWKIAFVALLAVVAVLLVVVLTKKTPPPFSTVTPASSPIQTSDPTAPADTDSPEETPDRTDDPEAAAPVEEQTPVAKKNPVETLIGDYCEGYAASRAVSEPLFSKFPLRLMSFDMATALTHSQVMDIMELFSDLDQGEAVGSWESATANINASEGSYAITASLEDGIQLTGTVSSTMTRMTCGATDAQGIQLFTMELARGSDGYYVQSYRPDGVYKNTRYMTSAFGLCCSIDAEQQTAIYDSVPVNWNAASAESKETMRATEGGAVIKMSGTESIYDR